MSVRCAAESALLDSARARKTGYTSHGPVMPGTRAKTPCILPRLERVLRDLDSVISDLKKQRRVLRAANQKMSLHYDPENLEHKQSLDAEHTATVMLDALSHARKNAARAGTVSEMSVVLPPLLYVMRTGTAHLRDVLPERVPVLLDASIHLGSIILDAAMMYGLRIDLAKSNAGASALLDQAKLATNFKIKKQYPKLPMPEMCNRCY